MKTHKTLLFYLAFLAVAVLCFCEFVSAETPRTFAKLTAPGSSCVNWESEGSKRIVARKDGQGGAIEFITPGNGWYLSEAVIFDSQGNVLLDLSGTRWVRVPVVHITDSGVDEFRFVYWLEDSEVIATPTGATSETGPLGDVLPYLSFRMSQASANSGANSGKFYIDPGGNYRFCVSVGLFNK